MRVSRYLRLRMPTASARVGLAPNAGPAARPVACIAGFVMALLVASATQAVTLQQLPYRNPAPLDGLLALDDAHFAATLSAQWPAVSRTMASYLPAGATLARTSTFADTRYALCVRAHEPGACRLLMNLLSFEMKSRRPPLVPASLPVLLRPTQLPWQDTALPRALLALDAPLLQSALSSHWHWFKHVITRFLPDNTDLHPVSKIFGSLRVTCQATRTEIACRNHLQDIVSIVDANRGQPASVLRTVTQIPYRDPAPLERLLALDEISLRSELSDWPAIDALLNQYIPASVAIAGDVDFARTRLDCQAWFPGDFFLCRNYLMRLSHLMQGKATMANPFQASR